MSSLRKDDVAPAPSRCRRGYNSPVLTLYFTNSKPPASPPSCLRLIPLRRRSGRRFDRGNQAAFELLEACRRERLVDPLQHFADEPAVRLIQRPPVRE